MFFFRRLISWTAAIVIFIFLELLIRQPQQIFWLIPLTIVIVFFSVWLLTGQQIKKLKFWSFLITPLLLLNSGWLFLIFLEGKWLKHIFLVFLIVLLWLFLKVVFLYFHFRPKYQAHTLENISGYLNLIIVFLLFSSFFDLLIFLNFPFWLLILISILAISLLTYQLFWVSDISLIANWSYIVIITLIVVELFLTAKFLPTSIYVNSLIITAVYYLLTGLARNWLLGIKELKVIKRYLAFSLISLVIILITAKWI